MKHRYWAAIFLAFLLLAVAETGFSQQNPETPSWLWSGKAGGGNGTTVTGYRVTTDAAGNRFVIGYFSGTVTFGTAPAQANLTSSQGSHDVFLVKYNSAGELQWVIRAGGSQTDVGYGVSVDADGNSYISGFFAGTASFGTTAGGTAISLNSNGSSNDIFLAKYDPSGTIVWARRAGGNRNDVSYGLSTDRYGNSYLTGYYETSATFEGTAPGNTVSLTSTGSNGNARNVEIFIAKYTTSGDLEWAKSAGGNGNDVSYTIAVDGSGSSYIIGYFEGSVSFGTTSAGTNGALTSSGQQDVFIAKYSNAGALEWASKAGGSVGDTGYGIAVDRNSNCYVTSSFSGTVTVGTTAAGTPVVLSSSGSSRDIFVAKYSSAGALEWARKAGGNGTDAGYGIVVDEAGSSYVTGYFTGSTTFGTLTAASSGSNDAEVFVAKYSAEGNELWLQRAGGSGHDIGYGITLDAAGRPSVVGTYSGTATFGTTSLTNSGSVSMFVGNLQTTFTPLPVELVHFSARKYEGDKAAAILLWQTATEQNNAFFAIERSTDGRNFEAIGRVEGAGNSRQLRSYSFTDWFPVAGAVNYYRLLQTDTDGTGTCSPVRAVAFVAEETALAFPNPTTGVMTVAAGVGSAAKAVLTDSRGVEVEARARISQGKLQLDLSHLPAGVYLLQLTHAATGAVSAQRVVKQ